MIRLQYDDALVCEKNVENMKFFYFISKREKKKRKEKEKEQRRVLYYCNNWVLPRTVFTCFFLPVDASYN